MRRSTLILALLGLAACRDPVDKAAKARIFSPEEPPRSVTRAAEDLGADNLAASPERIRRVFRMSAAEAAERLGPHTFRAHVELAWSLGGHRVKLDEDHLLVAGDHGDFSARLDAGDKLGGSPQGLEIVRVDGKVYARSRFGKLRERARDRGAAEHYREQVYGVLRAVYDLFGGRVALATTGETVELGGRHALKYVVSLADHTPDLSQDAPPLPPVIFPQGGPNPQLQHELDLESRKEPRALDGFIAVDAKTSVVLQAELSGALAAPGESGQRAVLKLAVTGRVADVGEDPGLAAPRDALPDMGRPQGIAAALERFDLPRATKGGADAGPELEEPDEGN